MPAKMHRIKVQFEGGDVYRYLLCCKRCLNWTDADRGHGLCTVSGKRKMGNCLSCESFKATGNGACDIVLETARLDGEMTKVVIGDKVVYCTPDEIEAIYDVLEL